MSAEMLTTESFEKMIKLLDKDGDGSVDQEEFTEVWIDMQGFDDSVSQEERMAQAGEVRLAAPDARLIA